MKKIIVLVAAFITLFMGLNLGVKGNEFNNQKLKQEDKHAYYRELEDRFVNVVRHTLEDDGYINAGITISSIIKTCGQREYIVDIHHDRFSLISEKERADYIERLMKIEFPEMSCYVTYNITCIE